MSEKYQNKYRIESNRAQWINYSAPGSYFITICTQNREYILGNVVNGKMVLSAQGNIVRNEILKIPQYHKRVILDEWVAMPNHVHLLIVLGDYDFDNGICDTPLSLVEKIHEFSLPGITGNPGTTRPDDIKQYRKQRRNMIIPKILGKFQMITSKQINIWQDTPGKKNWQSNYYDHMVRNEISFIQIKNYIIMNPLKWNEDKFH